MSDHEFDVEDPRGLRVTLTRDRYASHILRNHPELIESNLIQIAIQSPDLITADLRDSLVDIYYRRDIYPGYPHLWIRVVVKQGRVVTAFLVRQLKKGEQTLWTPGD